MQSNYKITKEGFLIIFTYKNKILYIKKFALL